MILNDFKKPLKVNYGRHKKREKQPMRRILGRYKYAVVQDDVGMQLSVTYEQ